MGRENKLFHVVVALGVGTALSAMGCSGGSTPSGSDASAQNDGSTSKDSAADVVTPPNDASTADQCAGWAPCC